MAEVVGGAIVQAAVQQPVSQAYEELISSVFMDFKSNMESLKNSRGIIEAVLSDIESAGHLTHAQQVTADKIRCQLDRLTDLFDVKEYRALNKQAMNGSRLMKDVRLFFSSSNQLFARFKDARKIKDIRKQLDSIARDHAQFGSIISWRPSSTQAQAQAQSVQPTALHIITNAVIGREEEKKAVVSMLSQDSLAAEALSVFSITGIGGVGKTTLARCVYNGEMAKRSFDLQFWVDVTQDFNVNEILKKIASSFSTKNSPKSLILEMDQPCECFVRAIAGKKFLLVLDNIWDQQGLRLKWLNLRRLLEFGAHGSKVLITTRDKKVAGMMDSRDPYVLGDLTEGDSWLLFQQIAFTQWQDPGVKAFGEEIINMCPKVPLVITSVGNVLAGKSTIQEWQDFRDDQFKNFASFGRDVMWTLQLSYDQLDEKLKLCVLYCSLFHKGYWFDADLLISLWIALGYVVPIYKHQSLEEAGEECLISLLNCGFFHIRDSHILISSRYVSMHDVMHELVTSLAGLRYKMVDSNTTEFEKEVRHVSVMEKLMQGSSVWELPSSLYKIKHLESFMTMESSDPLYRIHVSYYFDCDKLISRFAFLKVLVLRRLAIKELPGSIGELISLRHLDLSNSDIMKLPNSIMRLVNLLSLLLLDCYNLQELPKDMSKLVKLRHLKLGYPKKLSHMPTGLEKLTDLRTLDLFIVSGPSSRSESKANTVGRLADLNGLNHIKGELRIVLSKESKNIVVDAREANLKMKEKLTHLTIDFQCSTKEEKKVLEGLQPHPNLKVLIIMGYGEEMLPNWMMENQLHCWLPNLVRFEIQNCKSCRHICSLGRLPHLRYLLVEGLDNVEYMERGSNIRNINNNGTENELLHAPLFPSLEGLAVSNMPKLKGWWKISSSSSGNQHSSILPRVSNHQQHVVEWKPTCPKLRTLLVDNIEIAITIGGSLLEGSTSLCSLDLIIYKHLSSSPQALVPLNSCFPRFRRLHLDFITDIQFLPRGLQGFSSLVSLKIVSCVQLQAIPDWIDNLKSLKCIYIRLCSKLESLPHQISHLPTLNSLSIIGCSSLLEERCQNPNGEYWPYINHIPHLRITAAML